MKIDSAEPYLIAKHIDELVYKNYSRSYQENFIVSSIYIGLSDGSDYLFEKMRKMAT